jgi:2-oxoglutarate ferredoxin oxidoreductase subunit gamma
MEERILIAGAGGQGALTLGKFVAEVAMAEHRVTFFPSYGAEVRGGTAYCHVVVSDEEIASPVVDEATTLVIMNQASYNRFAGILRPDGLLVLNSSMAKAAPDLKCARLVAIPASQLASEIGDIRVANMIMLGAMNEARRIIGEKALQAVMAERLGRDSSKAKILDLNRQALKVGAELARKAG